MGEDRGEHAEGNPVSFATRADDVPAPAGIAEQGRLRDAHAGGGGSTGARTRRGVAMKVHWERGAIDGALAKARGESP